MGERHALDEGTKEYWGHPVETLKTIYGPGFRTITPQGYLVEICGQEDEPPEYGHYFCGPHDVAGAVCPNCDKPLLRLLAIDTRDPRLGLTYCAFDTLSLLFCMTCEIAMGDFYYQLQAPDGRVKILSYGKGKSEPDDIPFSPEPYPLYFQGVPVRLVALSERQQWYLIESVRLAYERERAVQDFDDSRYEALLKECEQLHEQHYRLLPHRERPGPNFVAIESEVHQIGGFPRLGQGWEGETALGLEDGCAKRCPICHHEMVFLAAVADANTGPRGFVGTGAAQFPFTWCPSCLVVGAVCIEA